MFTRGTIGRADGLQCLVNDDCVERGVRKRQRAPVHHVHLRQGSGVGDRLLYAGCRRVVPDDDCCRACQAAFRRNKSDATGVVEANLQHAFAQTNAAHRHRQRFSFETRFAQKHAHFLMI